jgi:DNA replication and repair protein RecF
VRRDGAKEETMDAITYASRGQGRTIALSLKLAEVELMRAETGEDPVLLLDDVMSELDAERRAALSQTVIDAPQAIITATDLADFSEEFLSRAKILRACGGVLE